MDIGFIIKRLRLQKGLTQEQFADVVGVTVQTISRWETSVNYPDIIMLPIIAKFFNVTTDYLLNVKGGATMKKLVKTVETFELKSLEEAKEMVCNFSNAEFPKLKSHKITEDNGVYFLQVTKEFNADVDNLKFDK